jgi:hypothetical protein
MAAAVPAADAHVLICYSNIATYAAPPPYLRWWQSQQQLAKRLLPAAAELRLLGVAGQESVSLCCVAAELGQPLAAQSLRCGTAAGLQLYNML